jgi:competence protein ComEC
MRASDIRVATPSLMLAIVAAAGVIVVILSFRRKNPLVRALGITAFVASSALLLYVARTSRIVPPNALEITSVDIGQGDSFLIVTPEGKTLLLDSGGMLNSEHANFDIGEDVVSPFLWASGVSHLDAVAVSHTHVDHVGGMPAIIHDFQPKELWLPPGANVRERKRLLEAAAGESTSIRTMQSGQSFSFGGALFEVLSPPPDIDFGTKVKDDDAMVVRISYEGTSALFVGDIGKVGEGRVIPQGPHADLLKVAHHGSANATSDEFLRAVHPSFAMISVGRHNSFGHPRPQTLQKLASAHVRTYRTDLFGATKFRLDRNGVYAMPLAQSRPR